MGLDDRIVANSRSRRSGCIAGPQAWPVRKHRGPEWIGGPFGRVARSPRQPPELHLGDQPPPGVRPYHNERHPNHPPAPHIDGHLDT